MICFLAVDNYANVYLVCLFVMKFLHSCYLLNPSVVRHLPLDSSQAIDFFGKNSYLLEK